MRIDPVFLVAPKPAPKAVPTRRAFLMAGGAFAFGSMIGGACGYSLGVAQGAPVEATAEKGGGEELGSSGDARLDALRRLAVKAPIEELVKNWNEWFAYFDTEYQSDPVLWRGMDRLAEWATANPNKASFELLTALVAASLQDKRLGSTLSRHSSEVRTLRSTKKR
ncbi:MAG: hypothetical protein KDC48_17550 [Planctomycetes bacterium]|nr:hypothetical protein [Planctomycetota bacterium]